MYELLIATNVDDLEGQSTVLWSLVSVMPVMTKRLRQASRGFCSKVTLYFSYICMHINFDDEIGGNSFKFQAQAPISLRSKLHWRLARLGYFYS